MEHYRFDDSHLPKLVLIPIHFIMTLFLSLITMNMIIKYLDFFCIGSDWLQLNIDLGFMIMLLVLAVSILIFDSLLSLITGTGGLIIIFLNLMKNDYDVNEYIEKGHHTVIKRSDIVTKEIIEKPKAEEIIEKPEPEKLEMVDKTEECGDVILFTMTLGKSKEEECGIEDSNF